jgi:hypothetical protein
VRYHVFIEGCRDTSPAGAERLASALGQRYGMSPPAVMRRLQEGRFCARASLDLGSAQRLVGELEAIGAHASLVPDGPPPPTPPTSPAIDRQRAPISTGAPVRAAGPANPPRYESGLAAAYAGDRLRDDLGFDLGALKERPPSETDVGWALANIDGTDDGAPPAPRGPRAKSSTAPRLADASRPGADAKPIVGASSPSGTAGPSHPAAGQMNAAAGPILPAAGGPSHAAGPPYPTAGPSHPAARPSHPAAGQISPAASPIDPTGLPSTAPSSATAPYSGSAADRFRSPDIDRAAELANLPTRVVAAPSAPTMLPDRFGGPDAGPGLADPTTKTVAAPAATTVTGRRPLPGVAPPAEMGKQPARAAAPPDPSERFQPDLDGARELANLPTRVVAAPSAQTLSDAFGSPGVGDSVPELDRRARDSASPVKAASEMKAAPAKPADPFRPPEVDEMLLELDPTRVAPPAASSGTAAASGTGAPSGTAAPGGPVGSVALLRAVPVAGGAALEPGLFGRARDALAESPRGRFAAGVALAFLIGLGAAQLHSWARSGSAYDDIRGDLIAEYRAADTPERWQTLREVRADAEDLVRARQHRMAVSSCLLWLVAAGAVGFVWFRVIDWPPPR